MLEQLRPTPWQASPQEIDRYDVSEDGEHWRPYDPQNDRHRLLHKRIVFAPSED